MPRRVLAQIGPSRVQFFWDGCNPRSDADAVGDRLIIFVSVSAKIQEVETDKGQDRAILSTSSFPCYVPVVER